MSLDDSNPQGTFDHHHATEVDFHLNTCTSDFFTINFCKNRGLNSNLISVEHHLSSTSFAYIFLVKSTYRQMFPAIYSILLIIINIPDLI